MLHPESQLYSARGHAFLQGQDTASRTAALAQAHHVLIRVHKNNKEH